MKRKIAVLCSLITFCMIDTNVFANENLQELFSDKVLKISNEGNYDYINEYIYRNDDLNQEDSETISDNKFDFSINFDGVLLEYRGNSSNVVIPDKVKEIGENAFSYNKNLKSVTIPDSVTKIGNHAFYNCNELSSINLPTSLKEIGSSAFAFTNIENIIIPSGVTVLNFETFYGCDKLKTIGIPSTVSTIGTSVFYDCTSLERIIIPEGIETIGTMWSTHGNDSVFGNCTALKYVSLPSTLKTIGTSAFYGCTSLEEINIPDNVTRIGSNAFGGCMSLKELNLPISLSGINVSEIADKKYTAVTAYTTKAQVDESGKIPFSINYKYQKDYLDGKPIPVSAVYYEKMTKKSMLEKEGKVPDEVIEAYRQDYLNEEFIPVSALRYYNWTGTYFGSNRTIVIKQEDHNVTVTVSNNAKVGFNFGNAFVNQYEIESNYEKGTKDHDVATGNNVLRNIYDIPEKVLFTATGKIDGTTVWLYPGQNYAVKIEIRDEDYGEMPDLSKKIIITDNLSNTDKNPFDPSGGGLSGEYKTYKSF